MTSLTSKRTWILGGLFAALLTLVAVSMKREQEVQRRWEAALAEGRRLEAECDARDQRRPVLWGESYEGRADPHYEHALGLTRAWDSSEVAGLRFASDEVARARRSELVDAGDEALAALHRGSHSLDASRRLDWRDHSGERRRLHAVRALVNLSEAKAVQLVEEGRDVEAIGVLLDAMQFAHDQTRSPILIEEMIGLGVLVPECLMDGVGRVALEELSTDTRRRLGEGLLVLEEQVDWPVGSLPGELALTLRALDAALNAGLRKGNARASLIELGTVGFRAQAAEMVDVMCGVIHESRGAYGRGPEGLARALTRWEQRLAALEPRNELLWIGLPQLTAAHRARMYSVGRLRLLTRAVVGQARWHDPWIADLVREEPVEGGTRVWIEHELFESLELVVGG